MTAELPPMPTLEAIFLGPVKREPMIAVDRAEVIDTGLVGDRYAIGKGTLSKRVEEGDAGRHVTLIEAEAIEFALRECGVDWSAGLHRRNLVVRGLSLNDLINGRIRIGADVILRGDRHCHPCRHLEKLTTREAMASLRMRGGLRARVLHGGAIDAGDTVELLEGQR